jgi:hypothetical protein
MFTADGMLRGVSSPQTSAYGIGIIVYNIPDQFS